MRLGEGFRQPPSDRPYGVEAVMPDNSATGSCWSSPRRTRAAEPHGRTAGGTHYPVRARRRFTARTINIDSPMPTRTAAAIWMATGTPSSSSSLSAAKRAEAK